MGVFPSDIYPIVNLSVFSISYSSCFILPKGTLVHYVIQQGILILYDHVSLVSLDTYTTCTSLVLQIKTSYKQYTFKHCFNWKLGKKVLIVLSLTRVTINVRYNQVLL